MNAHKDEINAQIKFTCCLIYFFSTMMANLFAMRSFKTSPDTLQWQNDYLQGTGCEMYTETLSPTFTGMTFSQASE